MFDVFAAEEEALASKVLPKPKVLHELNGRGNFGKFAVRGIPCKFFQHGLCAKGNACTFLHETPSSRVASKTGPLGTPCKFFAIGTCNRGAACAFLHDRPQVVARSPVLPAVVGRRLQAPAPTPCKFFQQGRCVKGAACTFGHGVVKPSFGSVLQSSVASSLGSAAARYLRGGMREEITSFGMGHLLPRTRISAEPFPGTVLEWKGKYGWIQPLAEIEHEKSSKHQGRIFFSKDDIIGASELPAGTTVQFHVWEDATGLGGDEVQVVD